MYLNVTLYHSAEELHPSFCVQAFNYQAWLPRARGLIHTISSTVTFPVFSQTLEMISPM